MFRVLLILSTLFFYSNAVYAVKACNNQLFTIDNKTSYEWVLKASGRECNRGKADLPKTIPAKSKVSGSIKATDDSESVCMSATYVAKPSKPTDAEIRPSVAETKSSDAKSKQPLLFIIHINQIPCVDDIGAITSVVHSENDLVKIAEEIPGKFPNKSNQVNFQIEMK